MASEKPELPNAGKWFNGFIDITRWIKDGGTLVRIIVLLCLTFLLYTGVKNVLGIFKKRPDLPQVTNVSGGKVAIDNTQSKLMKNGIINF